MTPRACDTMSIAAAALLGLGAWTARCSAQTELKPVDPGVADTSPLSTSQRQAPSDFRSPSAFERVYKVLNNGKDSGMFARQQGGLVAVFPRSQYVAGPSGATPEVPAGTIFYIGAPRGGPSRPVTAARPSMAWSALRADAERPLSRVNPREAPSPPTPQADPAPDSAPPPISMFTDDLFRVRRVASLLDRALGAGPETPRARD